MIRFCNLKVVVAIADKGDRPEQLKRTVNSLIKQCHDLRIYDNTKATDYTDNAKFYYLQFLKEPVYYFTCDSDIIYPNNYVEHTISLIEKHKAIITYHGRILKEPINSYYKGHTIYDFRGAQPNDMYVDVAGTGVCAFRTDYFNPVDIYNSEYKCMSDLVFSLEAKRQGKTMICAARKQNWLIQQEVEGGIMQTFAKGKQEQQIELAKSIKEL